MPQAIPIPECFEGVCRGFLSWLRVECGLSGNTLDAYRRDLRDLTVDLERHGITSVTSVGPRHLARHVSELHSVRGLAAPSVARSL